MNEQPLREILLKLILEIAPDANFELLAPDDDLREELDLDSIDFMRLLEAIDKEFGVNIPESSYTKVNTLQKMLDFIAKSK